MILTRLILAHLVGDFLLQPDKWVADKERKKLKSGYLYLHALLHAVLAFVALWDLWLWWMALLVGGVHFVIDAVKLVFQTQRSKRIWFFADQALHLLSLVLIASLQFPYFYFMDIFTRGNIAIITAVVFLTTPASIIIKMLLSAWTPVTAEHSDIRTDSLVNAGKYIGVLERLMVFAFILLNHWEGVGFMIAAKSVFRFSDLAEAKQRKLTEYVLIGTLLSFGIAIATAILTSIELK
ncbi:MAG: DUF3307 domain-containing protein [Chryseobacterium sp.]|nr:MAG: DUF3307 domain-containing protein [Chryseobacterium sp.]